MNRQDPDKLADVLFVTLAAFFCAGFLLALLVRWGVGAVEEGFDSRIETHVDFNGWRNYEE